MLEDGAVHMEAPASFAEACSTQRPEIPVGRKRVLRTLLNAAARSFDQESDYTTEEFKEEAAFRCWLVGLALESPLPLALPDTHTLRWMASRWDEDFGDYMWWSWPIWHTCVECSSLEQIECEACIKLASYCLRSNAWEYAMRYSREGLRDTDASRCSPPGSQAPSQ
jgi:hypothetical protein